MRRTHPSLLFGALCAASACSGQESNFQRLQPDSVVTTTSGVADTVDFGEVVVPYDAEQTFQVFNAGRATLNISDIRVELDGEVVDDGIYTLDLPELEVARDEQATVTVGFAPETYFAYNRTIVIESDDPEAPLYQVTLLGEGVDGPVPDIDLSADSIEFGTVTAGTSATEFVQIRNVGDGPLLIDRIEQSGSGAFAIEAGPLTGGEVSGGSETSLIISYTPGAETGDSAAFTIFSNDPDEPDIELLVVGNGGSEEEYPEAVIDCPADGDVNPPERIELDGRGSYDPEGREPLTYEWSVLRRPVGSREDVQTPFEPYTRLFVDMAGNWQVQLRVTNAVGLTSPPDTCSFFAEPLENLHVELTWDTTNSDLDLHLIQGGSVFFDQQGDACWCNRNPNWGGSGGSDDPQLTLDNLVGYGPENIKVQSPEDGDFIVKVHYFEDKGGGTSTATVRVFLEGGTTPFWEGSQVLTSNQVWDVGVIRWPDAVFAPYSTDPERAARSSCYDSTE